MIGVLYFSLVYYVLRKLENFLEILENNLDRLEIQTNNNVKKPIRDCRNLSEKGLICMSSTNNHMLTWILLFPFVICLYACHFWVNVSLFTINKAPIEFEAIRWSLQYSRIKLMELRITSLKKLKNKRRTNTSFYQPIFKFIPCFFKRVPKFFIAKYTKLLGFLRVFSMSTRADSESNKDETVIFKQDQVTSITESPIPIITRRVSVTVQEIIFEETEDSF